MNPIRQVPPSIAALTLVGALSIPLVSRGESAADVSAAIENAHHAAAWNAHSALACRVVVTFGGAERLNARLVLDRHAGRSRLTLADGTVAVFDGRTTAEQEPHAIVYEDVAT